MSGLRILHLSDSHLTGDGTLHAGLVDTVAAFRLTLAAFDNAGPLDLVVLSGDVSDDGSPASYSTLRTLTEGFAGRHGAVAVYAMGNHDERPGFREVLGNGHPDGGQVNGAGPVTGVSEVAGYRVVTLDSSVPGRSHGFLDTGQLDWLRAELAAASPRGTVVVVHHPPVPPVTALHHGIELQNPGDLADALAGSDAVAILSGHYHHPMSDFLQAGADVVPVLVAGGIANSNCVLAGPGRERATAGSGGTLITLLPGPGGRALVRALPVTVPLPQDVAPAEIFDLDPTAVAAISAQISARPSSPTPAHQRTSP
jgi:Icc protein